MSRVGKKPVPIPGKVNITYADKLFSVKGEKGVLSRTIHPLIDLDIRNDSIRVIAENEEKKTRALQGLVRSLVANMVVGVSSGFEKTLEITGIGYKVELSGKTMVFSLGYSHPVQFDIPDGISVSIEKNTILKLVGVDKEAIGHFAASIRRLRPPEPYKGKGIKYAKEHIIRKAGKTGAK